MFPNRPLMLFPMASFRLAVAVRDVTPTETQLPYRQQQQVQHIDLSDKNSLTSQPVCSLMLHLTLTLKTDKKEKVFKQVFYNHLT